VSKGISEVEEEDEDEEKEADEEKEEDEKFVVEEAEEVGEVIVGQRGPISKRDQVNIQRDKDQKSVKFSNFSLFLHSSIKS
jgi:hypothetical protein